MKTVWKFEFDARRVPVDEPHYFDLEIPKNAKLLHVDIQLQSVRDRLPMSMPGPKETPCIWAFVDPDAEKEPRRFMLVGTGHSIPNEPLAHVGSFKMAQDRLVFHLFEQV